MIIPTWATLKSVQVKPDPNAGEPSTRIVLDVRGTIAGASLLRLVGGLLLVGFASTQEEMFPPQPAKVESPKVEPADTPPVDRETGEIAPSAPASAPAVETPRSLADQMNDYLAEILAPKPPPPAEPKTDEGAAAS